MEHTIDLLSLPDEQRQVLECWLVDFDLGWDEGRLAARAVELPAGPLRRLALVEMARIDLERQWQGGRRLSVEDYLRDYPELGTADTVPPGLILAEYEVRRHLGVAADPDDFCRRFPNQASELRPILADALGDSSGTDSATRGPPSGHHPALRPRGPEVPGYELLGMLGRGGMGVVYKARQARLNRTVALKVLLHAGHATAEEHARFLREAEALARLRHEGVVRVHEAGVHGGAPFFSMEYVAGGSLADYLCGTPVAPGEAARLAEALARAVQAAHEAGIVHRDLKPANVLLEAAVEQPAAPPGEVRPPLSGFRARVSDFGLARWADEPGLSRSGAVLGTPSYMAPEQAAGRPREADARTDVYALGAVLYECLTGRPPFRAATTFDTLAQVLSEEPVPPRRLQPGVPRDLETVCLKCLHKEPGQRYQTAAALADDLGRLLRGEPVVARPVGRLDRGWRWCRRNPAVAALLTAFVLALLSGTVLSTYFALRSDAHYKEARGREEDANRAMAQLEVDLARSLLRPLGHQAHVVTAPEVEALEELAGSSDRVRLLFVEQALRGPVTSRQLRNRADMALHSAVGLDPTRRRQAEQKLLACLLDERCDPAIREDCVFIGLGLDECSQEFATAATRLTLHMMGQTTEERTLSSLAEAVGALAPRLGEREGAQAAARAVARVLEAMGKASDANALSALARAVGALAPRLGQEAAQAAAQVLDALGKPTSAYTQLDLARALAALAPRLGEEEAARAAARVVELVGKGHDHDRTAVAEAVGALASRLGEREAARVAARVLEAMGKTTKEDTLFSLARALAALAPWLGQKGAAQAAAQVLNAPGQPASADVRFYLAWAVEALAPRLGKEEAARAAARVVEPVVKDHGYGPPVLSEYVWFHLARAVGLVAPWLAEKEAARAATCMLENLRVGTNAQIYPAQAVKALAPRLGGEEAAHTAVRILEVMGGPVDGGAQLNLAWAVVALAPRLRDKEAANTVSRAAARVLEAMGKRSDAKELSSLARAVAALAPRLGEREAAKAAASAAARVLEAVGKTNDAFVQLNLAWAVAALAPWLGEEEAAQAAARVAARILETMDRTSAGDVLSPGAEAVGALEPRPGDQEEVSNTTERRTLSYLAWGVKALAPWLGDQEAAQATARVLGAIGKTTDATALRHLTQTVRALARRGAGESSQRARSLATAWVSMGAPPALLTGLAPLGEALRPLPVRFTEQQLVDFLKMSTCQRPARQVIVGLLGQKCGRHFAQAWEVAEWARVHRPDLDLTSPPRRPPKP